MILFTGSYLVWASLETCIIAKDKLQNLTLLPLLPKLWDDRCVPTLLAKMAMFEELPVFLAHSTDCEIG